MNNASPFPSETADSVLTRFMVGFHGTSLPGTLREYLARGLAGVALYPRNFRGPEDLLRLTSEIRNAAARPVLIGIDQEGGTKFSLPEPFTQWPSPADLGRLGDAALVGQMARAMAIEMRAAGCNLNFAPMLDLHTNSASPVTQGRSFGADPAIACNLGVAFQRGLLTGGVLPCAKHFPGHGDAAVDPHLDLPVFTGTMERLRSFELLPFAAAISAGVPLLMTAHILLPRIDPENPASLSRVLLDGVLRKSLRFEGVIVADDVGMGALSKRYSAGQAAIRSIQAGTDLVMICHDWEAVAPAIAALRQAREKGLFEEREWKLSETRVRRAQTLCDATEPVPPIEAVGCEQHQVLVQEIRSGLR